jgi:DNA-binding LytR/AlgR family response regulator
MKNTKNPLYIAIGARQEAQPNEILLFEADINYTKVHFANGRKLMVATTLKQMEGRFKCNNFLRIHKGFLVNMNYADHICEYENKLFLKNNQEVIVSRRRMIEVRQELQKQPNLAI